MKLVDYLRALLSQFVSKKDTGFIAEQSLPSASPVIYDGQLEYVAPKNGWAYGGISAVWEESGYVALKIGTSYMNQICYSGVGQGGGRLFFLPVKKGEKVILEHSSGKPLYLRFFENMGGGNLAHSIGGVLCLLGSSVHYLKRLSVVRKSGSVIREHQIHDTLIGVLLNLGRLESIQPRVMVKLCVELLEQQNVQLFKLKHHLIDCFFAQTVSKTLGIPAIQSPLKRVTRFTLLSDVKPLGAATSSLYQLSDRRSLGFGGALC